MNRNPDPVPNFSLGLAGRKFFQISGIVQNDSTNRARKLIFGLQVNIDKANSRRYDVAR